MFEVPPGMPGVVAPWKKGLNSGSLDPYRARLGLDRVVLTCDGVGRCRSWSKKLLSEGDACSPAFFRGGLVVAA